MRQRLRDKLAQRIGVVGVVAHDVAAAVLVKEFDGKSLHPGKHFGAQLVQEVLRDMRHKLRVDGRGDQAKYIQPDHGGDGLQDGSLHRVPAGGKALLDIARDGLDIHRRRNTDECADDDADHDDGKHDRILLEEQLDQAAQRLHVRLTGITRAAASRPVRRHGMISHCLHLLPCSATHRPRGRYRSS